MLSNYHGALNDVFRECVLKDFKYLDLTNVSLVSKYFYGLTRPILNRRKRKIQTEMKSLFSNNVIEIHGMQNLLFANEIVWDHDVEYLTVQDVKSKISYGIDYNGRSFLATR